MKSVFGKRSNSTSTTKPTTTATRQQSRAKTTTMPSTVTATQLLQKDDESTCTFMTGAPSSAFLLTQASAPFTIHSTVERENSTKALAENPEATPETTPSSPKPPVQTVCKCGVCAKLPIKSWDYVNSYLLYHNGLWDLYDNGGGMLGFVLDDPSQHDASRRQSPNDSVVLMESDAANELADRAQRHLSKLQEELVHCGLLNLANTTNHTVETDPATSPLNGARLLPQYSGQCDRARVIAPFFSDEVVLGPLLGCGGFASVYQVEAFFPRDGLHQCETTTLSPPQIQARRFLTNHAQRNLLHGANGTSKRQQEKNQQQEQKAAGFASTGPLPKARYAVKRLRRPSRRQGQQGGFRPEQTEKIEKAAIDLVLEAQLLLVMDHPNIVSMRGWSHDGVDAFRSGNPADYFLVMDLLPETLEDRIFAWRHALRKYRSRLSPLLPWTNKRKFHAKINRLLTERMRTALDIASALEYLHERRVIHRDIKCSNIGFDYHGDVKMFDLGLARLLPRDPDGKYAAMHDGYSMSRVGTKSTMAPEVRNKQPYTLSADVYSFGVVLWEIMSLSTSSEYFRRFPISATEKETGTHLPLPVCDRGCWPLRLQELVRACLSYKASERPTMAAVKEVLQDLIDNQCRDFGGEGGCGVKKVRRRSTFRLDLTPLIDGTLHGLDNTGSDKTGNEGGGRPPKLFSKKSIGATSVDLGSSVSDFDGPQHSNGQVKNNSY